MDKQFYHPGFWHTLPRPIIGLSPMDGVTDQPYRHIQKKYGRPDLVLTEFTSAEGLAHNATTLLNDFLYDETQRPVVAQIFGKDPESFYITAIIVCALGFDGLDINMGCPAKTVQQHGSGAALIRTPKLAQELIRAAQRGIEDWSNGYEIQKLPLKQKMITEILEKHQKLAKQYQERKAIPVSVKTRIGFDVPVIEEWISHLLEMEPVAITVHGRTLKQLYGGEASWEHIAQAKQLAEGSGTLILGNGDIHDVATLDKRVRESKVDGVLIGRATYGNPWLLKEMMAWRDAYIAEKPLELPPTPNLDTIVQVADEHAHFFESTYPESNFLPMRKHLAWYIKGFPNASEFRTRLVLANSAKEVSRVLQDILGK